MSWNDLFTDLFWFKVLRITIVYLCVIIVAGGIAYLGNQLGRHIGKRKMSLWRLRPRHTSIVITSVTGAVIAVLTLTIFAIFSEPVRGLLGGVEQLRREEAELRAKVADLQKTVTEGTFIWTTGEPIVHMTLPEGLPEVRTRAAITGLLAEANSRAVLRNNKIAQEKKEKPLNASDILIESDSANLDKIVRRLSSGTGVAGLRVVAEINSLYREKAPVRLECWPVKLVYKQGEVLLRRQMNPNDIVSEFYEFLAEVGNSAVKQGMIPIDGSLGGGLGPEDLKKLQQELNRQDGTFYLIARANRDLYETNSLDISVIIEPIPKPTPEPVPELEYW